jgi:hypothetical protein
MVQGQSTILLEGERAVAAVEQPPFVTFSDLMAKVGYFLFHWSLMEQQLTTSILTARERSGFEPSAVRGSVAERLNIWFELTSQALENRDKIDVATAVREQALALRGVRNLIVHGLQAGDSMPDDGLPYIRCAVGGYEQPTGETVCFTMDDLEHFTQGIDACRRAFDNLQSFNYRINFAAGR